jgi:hypothetical protein
MTTARASLFVPAIALGLSVGVTTGVAQRGHEPADEPIEDFVRRAQSAVCTILWCSDMSRDSVVASGTGFFIAPDMLVTARHVAAGAFGASEFIVELSDGQLSGHPLVVVEWEAEPADVVVLRLEPPRAKTLREVEGRFEESHGRYRPPRPLLWTREVPPIASSVFVIGSPLGLHGTYSAGVMSAEREVPDLGRIAQITAPISPGSSGSPVFDSERRVFGVVSSTLLGGQSLNFAATLKDVPTTFTRKPTMLDALFDAEAVDVKPEGRPPYLTAWASGIVTRAEAEASAAMFREHEGRILASLRKLLDEARHSPTHTAKQPSGLRIKQDKLERLLVAIEDNAPVRLPAGEMSPPTPLWRDAQLVCLDDNSRRAANDAAKRASRVGATDPRALRWIGDCVWSEGTLRRARERSPGDEAIQWELAECLAVRACIRADSLIKDTRDMSARRATGEWGVASPVQEIDSILDDLINRNPSWHRVGEYWQMRGWTALMSGRLKEAESAFAQRFGTRFPYSLWGWASHDDGIEWFRTAIEYRGVLWDDLGPTALVSMVEARAATADALDMEYEFDELLALKHLHVEVAEIVDVLERYGEEALAGDLTRCREMRDRLKKRLSHP